MICDCRTCKKPYWHFWGSEYPPRGYCSVPCHQERRTRHESAVELPATVLLHMYQHRMAVHGTNSILAWFDCRICDELEGRYADSLEGRYAEITADIGTSAAHTDKSAVQAKVFNAS